MPYRLIVADNSLSVRKTFETAFSSSEFSIRYFGNGDELASEILNLKFDALLLNVFIPGKDGYEIAKIVRDREDFQAVPMIFLKGAFDTFDVGKLSGLSYDGIFSEPFDSEGLVCYVRELIENRKDPETLPEELPLPAETKVEDELTADIEDKIERILNRKISEIGENIEKKIRSNILKEKNQK